MREQNSTFKILLIEDDEITNYLTIKKLNNLGFENIDTAENGLLAIHYLEKNRPNLIILDINMPIMDGFEFLDFTNKNNLYPNVPIIILTSSGRPSDREQAVRYNSVIDYLEKPLNYDKIQQMLLKIREIV
mgnify:CR=1 FL=1|tara:strand:+ start:17441 stop:17833 length:393 start_codon:yes stop_codon:yes gene_type:complete